MYKSQYILARLEVEACKGYNAFEIRIPFEQSRETNESSLMARGEGRWPMVVERFAAQQCFAATMRKQMIPLYRP